jgi:SAM-dependent methyltransferase
MTALLRPELFRRYYEATAARGHADNRDHYDRAAEGIMRRLRRWLPLDRNARCLDLACGCGETLYALQRDGFRNLTGVDVCAEELERARPYVSAALECVDALVYLRQAATASLDFVSALNFLEHLDKDELLAVLSEIARVLRPGGSLVAIVPNAVSPFCGISRHWDLTHEWAFVPNNFQQLAKLAGFAPSVEYRECGPEVHGLISGLRYLAWQSIRGAIALFLLVETASTKGGVYTIDMAVRLHSIEGHS